MTSDTHEKKKRVSVIAKGLSSVETAEVKKHIQNTEKELTEALVGVRYTANVVCPNCRRVLTEIEIQMGFVLQKQKHFTMCPDNTCRDADYVRTKFIPTLRSGKEKVQLLSSARVLNGLNMMVNQSPERILEEYPALYHSAIHYFGTLTKGFKEIGIKYGFDEKPNWYETIKPFLGKLMDYVIADALLVEPYIIGEMRQKEAVQVFKTSRIAKEVLKK